MNEIKERLQAPFPESDIEWRVQRAVKTSRGPKAVVLAYVTNRAIQNRLDEVFGIDGWRNEYKEIHQGILCGISIKLGDEWVTKWDGADLTNIEATKGGLSGSMKRAAVQWGIGRYLYNLDETWVDIKDKGENYINDKKAGITGYWDTPKLPDWALPESERKKKRQFKKSQNEESDGIKPETIGEIKKRWMENGHQIKALPVQIKKLYGRDLTGLSEVEGQEFLNKLQQRKGA